MVNKVLVAAISAALICAQCLAQSKYNNQLQPGLNTRDDAVRVFGQPLRALNTTQSEYPPPRGAERLVIEYRNGSGVIERIEAYFIKPYSRAAMIQSLKLPEQPEATRKNAAGNLVEYFGDSALLVLTYASSDASSGVKSLGYYSRGLFDRALDKKQSSSETKSNPASRRGFGPEEDNSTFQGAITLRYFGTNDIEYCALACAANPQCNAYTFVKPGAYESNPNNGVCYLSSSFEKKVSDPCCISAVKGEK